jgi:predicted Fe-Mo cluster-binding NifX family protein
MMRIAVTSTTNLGIDDQVFDHFEQSPYFTIVEIHNQLVKKTMIVSNPFIHQHHPGDIQKFLADMSANLVIAGGMEAKTREIFATHKIEVIQGACGLISTVIDEYLRGDLHDKTVYEPTGEKSSPNH